jgi:hypothetical protein
LNIPAKYRQILQEILTGYATNRGSRQPQSPDDVQVKTLIDTQSDHYQALHAGWQNGKQIFSVIFHFDLIDGKIWLQRNISDYDIVEDLEAKGVPKKDIVLAFHSPEMRPYTDYAAA